MIFEEKFNSSPQKEAYRKFAFAAQNASTAFFNVKLTHMGQRPLATRRGSFPFSLNH